MVMYYLCIEISGYRFSHILKQRYTPATKYTDVVNR